MFSGQRRKDIITLRSTSFSVLFNPSSRLIDSNLCCVKDFYRLVYRFVCLRQWQPQWLPLPHRPRLLFP